MKLIRNGPGGIPGQVNKCYVTFSFDYLNYSTFGEFYKTGRKL